MKKNQLRQLSVLAVLMLLVAACSQKTEYTHAIPANTTQLACIHLNALAEKAGIDDKENKDALKKLTEAMKSGMNAATFQQLEGVMKDPTQLGIDVTAPIYLFSAPTFDYITVVAKVSSEDRLKSLLEMAQKEQICSEISSGDGYSYATIDNKNVLAFNANTFLAVNYNNATSLDLVKEGITALLKQTEENSIAQNGAFKKMQKMNGDITLFVSPSTQMGEYAKRLNYGISDSIDLKELMLLGSLSFEKGKVEMGIESYTESAELKAIFDKQVKSMRPIENTFMKYFPKSTVALVSLGVNGEEMYNVLQENEQFRNEFSITKAAEVKNLFSTFQNDLTIGLINVTMSHAPSFLAYASVKDNAPLKAIYAKKAELGMGAGDDIVKLSEDDYVFKSRSMNIFFGIRNKQMYATNDEILYKNICKAVDPSLKDTDFVSGLKGKRSAFVINTEAVLQLPLIKMMMEYGGQEYHTYYTLANNVSYLEVTGDDHNKATITLQLKEKNVNALKQVVNFIKQFTGM